MFIGGFEFLTYITALVVTHPYASIGIIAEYSPDVSITVSLS